MGVISKPYKFTFQLIGSYLSQLYTNPIQTKSIANCVLAGLANYISQWLAHGKLVNHDALIAFISYGLLFGGSIPHYFNKTLSNFLYDNSKNPSIQLFLIERLFFMPAFVFFSWYVLTRLEGKNHRMALTGSMALLLPLIETNLKYLSLLHYINIHFVPRGLRIMTYDLINFIWYIVLSFIKQKQEKSTEVKKSR